VDRREHHRRRCRQHVKRSPKRGVTPLAGRELGVFLYVIAESDGHEKTPGFFEKPGV
jgi:hypothetical protein